MATDWTDVSKTDSSKDEELARDWLRATHDRGEQSDDVVDRVLELTMTDLNPARAWNLAKRLVELAKEDIEFFYIGDEVLGELVRHHEDLVGPELAALAKQDPRYRRAFKGQISQALFDLCQRYGIEI